LASSAIVTINLIHTLETISIFLVLILLIQIKKHYILCSKPKLDKKHRPVNKKAIQPKLNVNHHYKAGSKYYGHKLPELEVSMSSDQDIATFTKTPFLKDLALKTAIKKKKTKPVSEPRSTHKAILNGYIDDCFSAHIPAETEQTASLTFLDLKVDLPANDEIITVNEPSETF